MSACHSSFANLPANRIIFAALVLFLGVFNVSEAKTAAQAQVPITVAEVNDSPIWVPNIGNGPDSQVRLRNGKYKFKNTGTVNGCEQGEISCVATGKFNGRPAAVAFLTWNTGGSGWWRQVLLFRRINGKVESREYADLAPVPLSIKFTVADNFIRGDLYAQPVKLADFSMDDAQDLYALKKNTLALKTQEIRQSTVVLPDDAGSTKKWQLRNGSCKTEAFDCRLGPIAFGTYQDAPVAVAFAKTNLEGMHYLIFLYARDRNDSGVSCLGYITLPEGSSLPYGISGLKITDETVNYTIVGYAFSPANFKKYSK